MATNQNKLKAAEISKRIQLLEEKLKKELGAFFDNQIIPIVAFTPIEVIKQKFEGQVRTIIQSAIQTAYLDGLDVVAASATEHSPDFKLLIKQTDLNNITTATDKYTNQFWKTTEGIIRKESNEFFTVPNVVQPTEGNKTGVNFDNVLNTIATATAFSSFNFAIQSKQSRIPPPDGEGEGGPGIKQVEFVTMHDSKVDPDICQPLDGKIWDADSSEIVVPPDDTHPHCRCVLIPVVKQRDTEFSVGGTSSSLGF
jgi:hypothetical protein